jgi:hypothetical protein
MLLRGAARSARRATSAKSLDGVGPGCVQVGPDGLLPVSTALGEDLLYETRMRTGTTRTKVGLGLALAWFALLAFAAVAGGGIASGAVGPKVFRDPVGDAKGGPDFKGVSISDKGGVVKLVLDVSMKTPAGASSPFVETFFDTNGDGSADYMFSVYQSQTSTNWCFVSAAAKSKCIGSRTLRFNASGGSYTLHAASADLGGAPAFDFWVMTGTLTKGKMTRSDDSATNWSYTFGSVKLLLGTPLLNPSTPVAGQLFTITVPVTRSDGVQLPTGSGTRGTASMPTLNGEAVTPDDLAMQFKDGGISESFTLPTDAAGKVLKLSVSAMSGQMGLGMPGISAFSLNASRSFSFSVAPQH